MIKFTATILKFAEQGEKTGWTYIVVPANIAQKLKPGNKKSFRVKGKLDKWPFARVALLPMGEGDFIIPINAEMRKGTGKRKGAQLLVQLEVDDSPLPESTEFIDCLGDEPKALEFFRQLPKSHQNYFNKWIESAKTEPTKAKRIAQAVNALAQRLHFGLMLRALKANKD
jgi:hypothetical protein